MGRVGSWRVLLGSLRWMGLLLGTLEACSWSRTRSRSLGGGRSVVLELLLLLGLRRSRLGGSGLSTVSCRGNEGGREEFLIFLFPEKREQKFILQHLSILTPASITLTRVLHTILLLLLLLGWSAWLLRRVSARSLVLLVHLTYKCRNKHHR